MVCFVFPSIIVTIRNEGRSIAKLLDSLVQQKQPFEIIIVDAESTDNTQNIINEYMNKYEMIHLFIQKSSRGEGRNFGVSKAQGDVVVFTDGGCIADKNWLSNLLKGFSEGADIVSGKTVNIGTFEELERVVIDVNGYDITWPSCNLAYKKDLFERIKGFDTRFITAEDVDLNYRAISQGAILNYVDNAIINRQSAFDLIDFIRQSFWYGFGRKQLTNKHGRLWRSYSFDKMLLTHFTFQGINRLFFGLLGYLVYKFHLFRG